MQSIMWVFLWLITMLIPFSKTQAKSIWYYILSLIVGVISAWFFVGIGTPDGTMIWFLIGAKLLYQLAISFLIMGTRDDSSYSENKMGKIEEAFHVLFIVFSIIFVIFGMLIVQGWWYFTMIGGLNNANYFDHMVTKTSGLPFNATVPDNMLRLTTDELARSIARRHMSEFGSDVQILSNHITIKDGRLVWVVAIGSTNLWADNRVRGLVLVDANNPESSPVIMKDVTFMTGENLLTVYPFIIGDLGARAYHGIDSANVYGRAYITWDTKGDPKYILTSFTIGGLDRIAYLRGVYVFNQFGVQENYFEQGQIPSWITQPYDEGWLEGMINTWGGHRRGESFDVWAGGFLWITAPSNDRLTMMEDTRFIVDPDNNDIVSMTMVCPVGNPNALAGVMKATRDGIYFYDYRGMGYVSGTIATDVIESTIPKPTHGVYDAEMPLLYTLDGDLVWYAPVYWEDLGSDEKSSDDDTIQFKGLGIVNAKNIEHHSYTEIKAGLTGEMLVRQAEIDFINAKRGQPVQNGNVIEGVVSDISWTVKSGTKIYFIDIEYNSTIIHAKTTADSWDYNTLYKLEHTYKGDLISVEINSEGMITKFISLPN